MAMRQTIATVTAVRRIPTILALAAALLVVAATAADAHPVFEPYQIDVGKPVALSLVVPAELQVPIGDVLVRSPSACCWAGVTSPCAALDRTPPARPSAVRRAARWPLRRLLLSPPGRQQVVPSPRHPRPDGSDRHPAHVGRLGVGETEDLRQH